MHAVEVHAIRHRRVSSRQALAMDAGHVLRKLIHPLLRLELVNERGVAVAARAQLWDFSAGNLAQIAASLAHRDFVVIRVAVSTVQSAQLKPARLCTSASKAVTGACRSPPSAVWHSTQVSFAAIPTSANAIASISRRVT